MATAEDKGNLWNVTVIAVHTGVSPAAGADKRLSGGNARRKGQLIDARVSSKTLFT
jgi:hypothetical protein